MGKKNSQRSNAAYSRQARNYVDSFGGCGYSSELEDRAEHSIELQQPQTRTSLGARLQSLFPGTANHALTSYDLSRHPPDDGLVDAEIATFDGFWQYQTLDMGLSCTQASDIGAPSAENADFVVIHT